MTYNPINASKEQTDKIFKKHLKPFMGIGKILNKTFSWDDEDDIGFVELTTTTGKTISYQLRGDKPMFVEVTGFGSIRYDIHYPDEINMEMYNLLKRYGLEVKKAFWKGAQI
jgi:hypothetical protein